MYYPNNTLSDEITQNNDSFIIQAKPILRNASPLAFKLLSNELAPYTYNLTIYGKNFFTLNNVYVSASNPSILDNVTFHNPFSAYSNLYPTNPPFYAQVVPSFIQMDNVIQFSIPNIYDIGNLDIIVENDAGYGLLTRDTYNLSLSSDNIFLTYCFNGIQIN